jgi:hypothetical protein
LYRICEKPYEIIEERNDALGMDRAQEYRHRKNLEKLGMIQKGDKVGAKWQLWIPTAKGIKWAEEHGIKVHQHKSGIGHEFIVRKVEKALEKFSSRISFIAAGKSLGVSGIQPDVLLRVEAPDGDTGRRVAIQISATSKPEYEARSALELCRIAQIDVVLVIAKNKRARMLIERKVKELKQVKTTANKTTIDTRINNRSDKRSDKRSERRDQNQSAPSRKRNSDKRNNGISDRHLECPIVIDFETCMKPGYDWSFILGHESGL